MKVRINLKPDFEMRFKSIQIKLQGEKLVSARILVVDDDRLIMHTLSTGLRSAGYRTLEADSGVAAIKIAREQPPDLAIVDVRMPGMSGLELAEYLRIHTSIPTIFLSAHSDSATVAQAIAQGALGYLVKPLDVPKIIPSIETALVRAKELSGLKKAQAQLNVAMNQSRHVSMVVGVLMERYGLGKEQAFESLRKAARSKRRKLEDLASDIISGKLDIGLIVEIKGKT